MDNVTLYFQDGPSDKVYQASIHTKDGGYMVHYAYGRRGSTLNTGTKTQAPVSYAVAKDIHTRLIKEKMAKGYTQGPDSTFIIDTGNKTASGIKCQLLNPISEERVNDLLHDSRHLMQEKMDGRRLIIKKEGRNITGINRLGFTVALPKTTIDSAANYRDDFILDGEAMGDVYRPFDLLSLDGEDLRALRFADRCGWLNDLLSRFSHPHLNLVRTHRGTEKAKAFALLKKAGREGVVFKDMDASYTPGRPNAGGSQLKYKFYETASFIVTKPNEQRSVSLILFEGAKVRGAGNVTIPPNREIPAPGTVIECRYLYAFKESGAIFQPVYLGPREDILEEECTTAQLKYKVQELNAAA